MRSNVEVIRFWWQLTYDLQSYFSISTGHNVRDTLAMQQTVGANPCVGSNSAAKALSSKIDGKMQYCAPVTHTYVFTVTVHVL